MREGRRPGRIPLVDDVLDWLSDKEQVHKVHRGSCAARGPARGRHEVLRGTKVDNATTDAFVIFLVLLPLIVIVGAVKVFDLDTCWRSFC